MKRLILLLAALALAIPALALAAHPVKGGQYGATSDGFTGVVVNKSGKATTKKGITIEVGNCGVAANYVAKAVAITKKGTFAYKGKVSSFAGTKNVATVKLAGKFLTAKKAKMSYRMVEHGCVRKKTVTLTWHKAG